MTAVSIALVLLAALVLMVWLKRLHYALALLGLFAGIYVARTSWLGPHLFAIGNWVFTQLGHIRL